MRLWLVVALIAACSDRKSAPPPEPAAPPPTVPTDARPSMFGGPVGSASGMHLDDDVAARPAQPATAGRRGQMIDIVLRSSPTGAMAAVDGVPIGPTPTNWTGVADGTPHQFTFTRSGYAFARYRFVPITSGVIHARLEPIGEDGDAGVPPANDLQGSSFVPGPPPTVIAPADAAIPSSTPPTHGPQP